jgi:hypothetical protein
MRVYKVTSAKKTLIVAAHNSLQAIQVSGFKGISEASEVNITEPIIICQESTPTEKSDSTLGK